MKLKNKLFWLAGIICFLTAGLAISQESAPSKDSPSLRELIMDAVIDEDATIFKKYPGDSTTFIGDMVSEKYGEVLPVTVATLYKAYDQNEIKADMQYKDKLLLVSGQVASIDKSLGSPVLHLRTNNPYLPVEAFFKKSKSEPNKVELTLSEFKKGQAVNLLCTGAGKTLVPVLNKCEFVDAIADAEKEEVLKEAHDALEGRGDKQKYASLVFGILSVEEQMESQVKPACIKSKANCARAFSNAINKLIKAKQGKGSRGKIGVFVKSVTKELADKSGLKDTNGAVIVKLEAKGSAEKAGLKKDDIVTEINGNKINDAHDLYRVMASTKPGSEASITVIRDGSEKTVTAVVASRPLSEIEILAEREPPKAFLDLGYTMDMLE